MPEVSVFRQNLPANKFPFTILLLNSLTREEVWRQVVAGPGKVYVPAIAHQIGCPVVVQILWPDGSTDEFPPVS